MTGSLVRTLVVLVLALGAVAAARAADSGSGYFRMADARLDVRHAIAVVEDTVSGEGGNTLVFFSAEPLDAARVANAFDAMDAVREQEPEGGYVRVCIDAQGSECGLYFSPEGFNSGGYGEVELKPATPGRIAGRFHLDAPEDFFGRSYQFDLRFDTAITAAAGAPLPADGGEPGRAYNAWLAALAKGDLPALRRMRGEEGRGRYPEDDPADAKQALKDDRDGQPLQAQIERGRQNGDTAVLWVRGVDRDHLHRAGRVLMRRTRTGWQFDQADLETVDE